MIVCKAVADAQMNRAGSADVVCLHAVMRAAAALRAISFLLHMSAEVLAGQRISRMTTCSTLAG